VRLPINAVIAPEKLNRYLLAWKPRDDKSQWLAQAGYVIANWPLLEQDIRDQLLPLEAIEIENNRYGVVYRIDGKLTGLNGNVLSVRTIWMVEHETGQIKFITMYPSKGEEDAF
jgi:hypothetical protein